MNQTREGQILNVIKESVQREIPGAETGYAVRKMRTVVTVLFRVGPDGGDKRKEFRITVEDVS